MLVMKCEHFDSGMRTSSVVFQTAAGEGRVYKCLFNHKFEDGMSEKVKALKCHLLKSAVAARAISLNEPVVDFGNSLACCIFPFSSFLVFLSHFSKSDCW